MKLCNLWLVCLALDVSAYGPLARWGQATAVINDALFVQGGKTDQYNSYSYTSAPNIDDLLYLSLSTPFNLASTPWQLISSSSNSSTTSGPAVAWHTLSAFNTTEVLLFGGDPGPNSATVLLDQADSAALLDVYDQIEPVWITESLSWANEPMRRIHHSTSSARGLIWIIGGEKADGSGNDLSDHYVFNPNIPSFTQLPIPNGPPDIYGHTSIVLDNGLLVVFGGYSQSLGMLAEFTTIWALNTTAETLEWTSLLISNTTFPSSRRAFAAVLLDGGKILIHGGADAYLETAYEDGWILDTTQNPMVWSTVPELSQLGTRYDHFAVAVGSQVIFGFGYTGTAPANAQLQVYDISSSSWQSSFTPPPIGSATSYTLPGPTQTPHSAGSPPHTGTNSAATPTGISSSGNPAATTGSGGTDGRPSGNVNVGHTTAIAVGATIGALAFIVIGAFGA